MSTGIHNTKSGNAFLKVGLLPKFPLKIIQVLFHSESNKTTTGIIILRYSEKQVG